MIKTIKSMNNNYSKLLLTLIILLSVTGVSAQDFNVPVIENEVEDKNITGADVVGASPNVVTILDLSGSMGRNHGNQQVGSWDQDTALEFCEREQCGGVGAGFCGSSNERRNASQCAEVIANTNRCGFACREGRCELFDEIVNFDACVQDLIASGELTDSDVNPVTGSTTLNQEIQRIYNNYCGGNTVASCSNDGNQNRVNAVQELSNNLGLALCGGGNGPGSPNCAFTCNSSTEYNNFRSCMNDSNRAITVNQVENCLVPGNPNCFGEPEHGSSRLDVALSVFLDVLDADNSLENDALCNDTAGQFDGGSPISCQDYLFTPFRNVENIILGNSNLPSPTSDLLMNQLTNNDGDVLNINLQPMFYSGNGNGDACDAVNGNTVIDDQSAFGMASGGFQGGDASAVRRVWEFYRDQRASGGTPLALILGFDDAVNPTAGGNSSVVRNDALLAFSNEMPTDPALDCRPQFTIVITDGDDSCSGDCDADSSSCNGVSAASNNSNRRSSIKAVSNLRTYFSRINGGNGVNNTATGKNVKKEVLTFVIGLGIDNEQSRRALNAMALAGGTHTSGIIRHADPATGAEFGELNIFDFLPGDELDEFQVLRDIAKAEGLDSNPNSAVLGTCGTPVLNGTNAKCTFDNEDVFTNAYFDSGELPSGTPVDLDGFAFFADNAEELVQALNDILITIQTFTTSGVAPTAPQSSINVSARDRMFLSILTPRVSERMWQGRLALYGFVSSQIPNNPGARTIIRRPQGANLNNEAVVADISIFSSSGNLDDDAREFFWDAAKNLAERDLTSNPRNLLTTDRSSTSSQNSNVIISDLRKFCSDNPNTANPCSSGSELTPAEFGIEDEDVYALADYPPVECDEDTDLINCSSDCTDVISGAIDIMDVDAEDCRDCIKGCLRDQVVDFMGGNTGIRPVFDPMGQPTESAQTSDSIGYGCPNAETGLGGSLDNCSQRMGDIFHSTPVLVASPSPLFFDAGFQAFARGFLDRSAALYAGANDGFLHAFHAGEFVNASEESPGTNPFTQDEETVPFFDQGTGIEVFGFAPPTYLIDSLSVNEPEEPFGFTPDFRLGDFKSYVLENQAHRSFFDGSPTIADIWIDAYQNGLLGDNSICPQGGGITINSPDGTFDLCGREWHTVLTSGMRNGGGAITSLNVTNFACGKDVSPNADPIQFPQATCPDSDGKHENSGADYPEHLWTTYDEDFGNTWSQPFVGRVRLDVGSGTDVQTVDRFVYFVGGGLDPTDTDPRDGVNKGNGFYVLDAPTGNILFKFHPDNPSDSTLENISDMQCDMAANLLGVDINIDGYTDVVYIGDTCGRLWRFDVSMPLQTSGSLTSTGLNGSAVITAPDWSGGVAFCTGTCLDSSDNVVIPPATEDLQSIYFAPTAAFDRIGRRHVIFVTGNRRNPSKIADFDPSGNPVPGTNEFGRLFNFIDTFVPAFLAGGTARQAPVRTESELLTNNQVVKLESSPISDPGLFVVQTGAGFNEDLGEFIVEFPDNDPAPNGEKGFGRPLVLGRVLVFTTFAPDSTNTNPCIASFGDGRLFALDYLTGQPALNNIPGAQESILGSVASPETIAGAKVAEGLPTSANLAFGTQGSAVLTVAFSGSPGSGGAQFLIWETPQRPATTQTVFWQEIL